MADSLRFIDRLCYEAGPNFLREPWPLLVRRWTLDDVLRLKRLRAKNARMIAGQYRGPPPVSFGTRAVSWRKR